MKPADVANAEAGEAAVREHEENADEDEEGATQQQNAAEMNAVSNAPAPAAPVKRVRPPIVSKMFYWSALVGINCVTAIIQLIVLEDWETIPQGFRYNRENYYSYLCNVGACGFIMTTCQILMFTPKRRRGTGQGSTAGSMQQGSTKATTA